MWESAETAQSIGQDPFNTAASFLVSFWSASNAAIFSVLFTLIFWHGDFVDIYGKAAALWPGFSQPVHNFHSQLNVSVLFFFFLCKHNLSSSGIFEINYRNGIWEGIVC